MLKSQRRSTHRTILVARLSSRTRPPGIVRSCVTIRHVSTFSFLLISRRWRERPIILFTDPFQIFFSTSLFHKHWRPQRRDMRLKIKSQTECFNLANEISRSNPHYAVCFISSLAFVNITFPNPAVSHNARLTAASAFLFEHLRSVFVNRRNGISNVFTAYVSMQMIREGTRPPRIKKAIRRERPRLRRRPRELPSRRL